MKWFTRIRESWKREMRIYYQGVAAGRNLMNATLIEIPDEIQGSDALTRVFISGLDAGVKNRKYLEREEAKTARKYLDI